MKIWNPGWPGGASATIAGLGPRGHQRKNCLGLLGLILWRVYLVVATEPEKDGFLKV